MRWGNIVINNGRILVAKKQRKTKTFAYVPINQTACGIINDKRQHAPNEAVFPQIISDTTSDSFFNFRQIKRISGLQFKIDWHTARYMFAIHALDKGADLYTVSSLLGHKRIATTTVYAKITDRLKREAVDRLDGLIDDIADKGEQKHERDDRPDDA